jgi:hypothetical protein
MMETFLLAFGLVLMSVLGLALGVILGRAPLKGSCGGLACATGLSCSGCREAGSDE